MSADQHENEKDSENGKKWGHGRYHLLGIEQIQPEGVSSVRRFLSKPTNAVKEQLQRLY